ncbi:MAG: hypothetical protein GY845_15280 [Planctomycetes bacterium]|nr:hypothetical protein [Planctomycetota bacterium]
MRFINSARIDSIQLRQCLHYLEESCQIAAFQANEVELYNEALRKYGNFAKDDSNAIAETGRATDRLAQAAKEALGRHEDIDHVPMPALSMHYAWWATLRAYSAWASDNKSITDGMRGIVTETAYTDKLMKEYQKAWIKAEKEEKRFIKHLKINTDDVSRIITLANNVTSAEKWEPASTSVNSLPTEMPLPLSETDHEGIQANHELSMSVTTELTASVKKRYKLEDVKWLTDFVRLYDQAKINDITRLDSDNMPVDFIATLDGATIFPPILKDVESLPRPINKQLRSLMKAFQDALRAAIIASEDVRELAECQSNQIPAASIAFDLTCAADMTEQLNQKLGKVLGK